MVGGKTVTFKYNADGTRTEKHLSGTHDIYYRLLGDKVVEMKKLSENGTERYVFIYDEIGTPYAIEYYNGYSGSMSKYYYVLNLQGDVIQLVDSENCVVCNYTYDAWGKLLSVTDSSGTPITDALSIANVNPIRYRGYFYDTETGLYYCNSRYYDPQTRRFVNADGFVSTGQGFGGYNMFAYCFGNPVMYCDPSGTKWVSIRKFVEERGGTADWNFFTGIAKFKLNGITLHTNRWGENYAGFNVENENGRMKANDYDLAYYFQVDEWVRFFPGFFFYDEASGGESDKGFQVKANSYFLSKKFCLDFASEVIRIKGKKGKYLGKDKYGIAKECYGHAVCFMISSISTSINKNWGHSYYLQAENIGYVGDDPFDDYYEIIWDPFSKLKWW